MSEGFLLALAAAICWGLTDVSAALISRRVGTVRTAAISLLVSVTVLSVATLVSGTRVPDAASFLLPVAFTGVVAALATLSFWQALRMGPLVVVSPIGAAAGVATVVLAVVFLGEDPRPVQLLSVPVAGAGCVLAALVYDPGERRVRIGAGPLFAAGAVLLFALVTVVLRQPIRSAGWLPTILVSRVVNASLTWLVLGALTVRSRMSPLPDIPVAAVAAAPPAPPIAWYPAVARAPAPPAATNRALTPRTALLLLGVGALDVSGLITFSIGLARAPAWLVGLVGSCGPVVAVLVGLLVLRERLRPSQWLGLLLVAVGLALEAFG